MQINAETSFNFVIGDPIGHSLSPSYHQALYSARGINAVMLALEKPVLPELIRSIKTLKVRLTAVTMPYKIEILSYVDTLCPEVQAIGAANTLILDGDQITAYNTDIDGIMAALNAVTVNQKNCLILGAGGAARAVAYVLNKAGANSVYFNRTPDKAQELARQFGGEVMISSLKDISHFDVIINTVPTSPEMNFRPGQIAFDLSYYPEHSVFLKQAKSAGATLISGITMFHAQAEKQCDLAYGVFP